MSTIKQTLLAVLIASSFSTLLLHIVAPQIRANALRECVENTPGSDMDCEQCYFEIYGTLPN